MTLPAQSITATYNTLLVGATDANTDASAAGNTNRLEGRVANLRVDGHFQIDEDAAETFMVEITPWLMVCSPEVASNWTLNTRTLFVPTANISAANPVRIIAKGRSFTFGTGSPGTSIPQATISQGRYSLRAKYPVKLTYPMQLYLFFSANTLHDGTTAGIPDAAWTHTFKFFGKLARANMA